MISYFRGTKAELRRQIYHLVAIMSGRASDENHIGKQFAMAIGYQFLADIHNAYDEKARGRIDDMGYQWAPLSPITLFRRRNQSGQPNEAAQRKLERLQKSRKGFLRDREQEHLLYLTSIGYNPDSRLSKKIARQVAEAKYSSQESMLSAAAAGDVEILKDTGVLFGSLTPGVLQGFHYSKPTVPGGEDQIFDVNPGEVILGTSVEYGHHHQHGTSRIPARPFLPVKAEDVPAIWWDRVMQVASDSFSSILRRYFS